MSSSLSSSLSSSSSSLLLLMLLMLLLLLLMMMMMMMMMLLRCLCDVLSTWRLSHRPSTWRRRDSLSAADLDAELAHVAASFQRVAVGHLAERTKRAIGWVRPPKWTDLGVYLGVHLGVYLGRDLGRSRGI